MDRQLAVLFSEFLKDKRGATAVDYALIAAGVVGTIIGAVADLSGSAAGNYADAGNALNGSPFKN